MNSMNVDDLVLPQAPLLRKIKQYKKRMEYLKDSLNINPSEWGVYQSDFSQTINGIFRDIMIFERENEAKGNLSHNKKFREFFLNNFLKEFSKGEYIKWSQDKPYGYAGDYQMINFIYENSPTTEGVDRLFDNYMQMSSISVAVRNRKDDFRKFILDFILARNYKADVLNLACGPCREIFEIFQLSPFKIMDTNFTCIDNDQNALSFSEKLLPYKNVEFFKKNAVKLALKKNIEEEFGKKFDLIYSTGLFDYLGDKVAVRLIANMKKLLSPNGVLIIADVQSKYSNPSFYFMILVGLWELIYRQPDNFKELFLKAGFSNKQLKFSYEQQGIMQYIIASNSN